MNVIYWLIALSSDEEDGEADTDGFSLEEIRKYLADKLHHGAPPKVMFSLIDAPKKKTSQLL